MHLLLSSGISVAAIKTKENIELIHIIYGNQ